LPPGSVERIYRLIDIDGQPANSSGDWGLEKQKGMN